MRQELMVPMRDGVKLQTEVAGQESVCLPVVLLRGYSTDSWIDTERFVQAGT